MNAQRKDIDVEEFFDRFVEEFGGELVSKLLTGKSSRPLNADYFFRDRSIVAELKCLEKNYFNDVEIRNKISAQVNQWVHQGLLHPKYIKDGFLQIEDFPRECTLEVFQIFLNPMRQAIVKANKQIKATKSHFNLPNAKGLLILANDGNYSIGPKLAMQMLANLLPKRYTGIDSFIYFTPNMRVTVPQMNVPPHVWISGPSRPSANEVEPGFLNEISHGWFSFWARTTGETLTTFHPERPDLVDDMKLVR